MDVCEWMNVKAKPSLDKKKQPNTNKSNKQLGQNASAADISHALNNTKHYGYAENIHSDI